MRSIIINSVLFQNACDFIIVWNIFLFLFYFIILFFFSRKNNVIVIDLRYFNFYEKWKFENINNIKNNVNACSVECLNFYIK